MPVQILAQSGGGPTTQQLIQLLVVILIFGGSAIRWVITNLAEKAKEKRKKDLLQQRELEAIRTGRPAPSPLSDSGSPGEIVSPEPVSASKVSTAPSAGQPNSDDEAKRRLQQLADRRRAELERMAKRQSQGGVGPFKGGRPPSPAELATGRPSGSPPPPTRRAEPPRQQQSRPQQSRPQPQQQQRPSSRQEPSRASPPASGSPQRGTTQDDRARQNVGALARENEARARRREQASADMVFADAHSTERSTPSRQPSVIAGLGLGPARPGTDPRNRVQSLRRAMVLSEVFGRPVALRPVMPGDNRESGPVA